MMGSSSGGTEGMVLIDRRLLFSSRAEEGESQSDEGLVGRGRNILKLPLVNILAKLAPLKH